jgi:putative PIN family toxin of toxin-antitoxin system
VVLDTNVLLVSIPSQSKYRPIFNAVLNGNIELILSNDIINEYIEIIERKTNSFVANNIGETLLNLDNVIQTNVRFNWNLIEIDKEDNKFVDVYIAGSASILVTNDKHFEILKQINFPQVVVMDIDQFLEFVLKYS